MVNINIFIVFLAVIATGLSCQLPEVCDSECTTLEKYIQEKSSTVGQTYRLQYHVAPPVGWMNDPNGFIFYKGNYHIFYQFYPYDSKWGPMHWGHSTSPDLVDWMTQITALIPGKEQCFSGSALVLGSTLVLMYTGHVEANETTDESQYLAFSDNGINFIKYAGNPVLKHPTTTITPDFRDPKVWKHEDHWYVVVGTKTSNGTGKVELYRSPDLINWTYLSVIGESKNITAMGYMWECPDFFELGGRYVLMMSPQGMAVEGDRYKNKYQTGYILGNFSYTNFQFTPETEFQELDYGHDFYATQTTENSGSRILIAWFGMWTDSNSGTNLTESLDGWAGALTIFRSLTLSGDRILMNPVDAMINLRTTNRNITLDALNGTIEFNQTGELIVKGDWNETVELLLAGNSGGGSITLTWDKTNVIVDRGGDIRQVAWTPLTSDSTWRIFLDTSSLELFCGDGEVVFSSRVYPLGGWNVKNMSLQVLPVVAHTLRKSVP